jgi:imidazolonepropionase
LTLHNPHGPRHGSDLDRLGIVNDGSLLIQNGVVLQAGSTRRIENLREARGALEISAAGRVVMPGFVDSHTHLVFPPAAADSAEIAAAVQSVRDVNGKRLVKDARDHVHAMARHGTTTVEVKTGCWFDENAETKLLRVIEALAGEPIDVVGTFLLNPPQEGAGLPDLPQAVERIVEQLLPKIRRRRSVAFADLVWHDDPAWHGVFARYLESAARLGFRRRIHGVRFPVEALTAATQPLAAIEHLEDAGAEDVARVRRSRAGVTLLPATSLLAGMPFAPARALIDAGVRVALASNFNPRVSPCWNMQGVVALAVAHMRMTVAEAIAAATLHGARALGRAAQTGSLEAGKTADLVILNLSDCRDLARQFGGNLVHATMKRGAFIYQEAPVAPLEMKDLWPL